MSFKSPSSQFTLVVFLESTQRKMCLNNVEYTKAIDDTNVMPEVPKHNINTKQIYTYFSETKWL
jgi:hypothetical protein